MKLTSVKGFIKILNFLEVTMELQVKKNYSITALKLKKWVTCFNIQYAVKDTVQPGIQELDCLQSQQQPQPWDGLHL